MRREARASSPPDALATPRAARPSPPRGGGSEERRSEDRGLRSGHLLLGTRSDWQRHLKLAQDELGFTGIRGHGLLDDDMSVVPSKGGAT